MTTAVATGENPTALGDEMSGDDLRAWMLHFGYESSTRHGHPAVERLAKELIIHPTTLSRYLRIGVPPRVQVTLQGIERQSTRAVIRDRRRETQRRRQRLLRLTDKQVAEVRRRIKAGESHADLAKEFAISRSTVSRIADGTRR